MCELQKVLNAKYVMLDQFCFGVLCDEIEVQYVLDVFYK